MLDANKGMTPFERADYYREMAMKKFGEKRNDPQCKCFLRFEEALQEAIINLIGEWPGNVRDISRTFHEHYKSSLIDWIEGAVEDWETDPNCEED